MADLSLLFQVTGTIAAYDGGSSAGVSSENAVHCCKSGIRSMTFGPGALAEMAMNADTKTLYVIIIVCAAVLIGGILLYVKFDVGNSRKRRGGNDDPPYTPNLGHKSSIPIFRRRATIPSLGMLIRNSSP